MHIIYGVTTYNRLNFLKKHIESWNDTRNKSFDWTLIISDDGSNDGTIEYIKSLKFDNHVNVIKLFNDRRGVHYGINKILQHAENSHKFHYGFKSEDDIVFKKSGWDEQYIKAIKLSGFHHLCFFDYKWYKKQMNSGIYRKNNLIDEKRNIQCKLKNAYDCFGCFWTFTKKSIKKVGYIDVKNFGLSGNGHSDITLRNCRAGYNELNRPWDAYKSEDYIKMILEGYHCAMVGSSKRWEAANFGLPKGHSKWRVMQKNNRIYVPYREFKYNMRFEKIE